MWSRASRCCDRGVSHVRGNVGVEAVRVQYQADLPPVRPHVTAFHVHVGRCRRCGRRPGGAMGGGPRPPRGPRPRRSGRARWHGAAWLHTGLGVPFAKVATILRAGFGLAITPGGLATLACSCETAGRPIASSRTPRTRPASRASCVAPTSCSDGAARGGALPPTRCAGCSCAHWRCASGVSVANSRAAGSASRSTARTPIARSSAESPRPRTGASCGTCGPSRRRSSSGAPRRRRGHGLAGRARRPARRRHPRGVWRRP